MNQCINIADFRCRASKPRFFRSASSERKSIGISAVKRRTASAHATQLAQQALIQENPAVYDIGVAREVQRGQERPLFRPVSIRHRAEVLRFSNHEPLRMKARAEDAHEKWRGGVTEGPFDLPPAA